MRVKEIPEPTSPCLGFQLLENRRVEVRIASGGHLCLVQLLRRIDSLVHKRGQALLEVLAALAQFEVHCRLPVISGAKAGERRSR
jgi:hypothetical protein